MLFKVFGIMLAGIVKNVTLRGAKRFIKFIDLKSALS